jgi:hypothetical protein
VPRGERRAGGDGGGVLKVKYALPGEAQRREMQVISDCWDLLSKLDSHARYRVLGWLGAWVRAEVPEDEKDDVGSMPW